MTQKPKPIRHRSSFSGTPSLKIPGLYEHGLRSAGLEARNDNDERFEKGFKKEELQWHKKVVGDMKEFERRNKNLTKGVGNTLNLLRSVIRDADMPDSVSDSVSALLRQLEEFNKQFGKLVDDGSALQWEHLQNMFLDECDRAYMQKQPGLCIEEQPNDGAQEQPDGGTQKKPDGGIQKQPDGSTQNQPNPPQINEPTTREEKKGKETDPPAEKYGLQVEALENDIHSRKDDEFIDEDGQEDKCQIPNDLLLGEVGFTAPVANSQPTPPAKTPTNDGGSEGNEDDEEAQSPIDITYQKVSDAERQGDNMDFGQEFDDLSLPPSGAPPLEQDSMRTENNGLKRAIQEKDEQIKELLMEKHYREKSQRPRASSSVFDYDRMVLDRKLFESWREDLEELNDGQASLVKNLREVADFGPEPVYHDDRCFQETQKKALGDLLDQLNRYMAERFPYRLQDDAAAPKSLEQLEEWKAELKERQEEHSSMMQEESNAKRELEQKSIELDEARKTNNARVRDLEDEISVLEESLVQYQERNLKLDEEVKRLKGLLGGIAARRQLFRDEKSFSTNSSRERLSKNMQALDLEIDEVGGAFSTPEATTPGSTFPFPRQKLARRGSRLNPAYQSPELHLSHTGVEERSMTKGPATVPEEEMQPKESPESDRVQSVPQNKPRDTGVHAKDNVEEAKAQDGLEHGNGPENSTTHHDPEDVGGLVGAKNYYKDARHVPESNSEVGDVHSPIIAEMVNTQQSWENEEGLNDDITNSQSRVAQCSPSSNSDDEQCLSIYRTPFVPYIEDSHMDYFYISLSKFARYRRYYKEVHNSPDSVSATEATDDEVVQSSSSTILGAWSNFFQQSRFQFTMTSKRSVVTIAEWLLVFLALEVYISCRRQQNIWFAANGLTREYMLWSASENPSFMMVPGVDPNLIAGHRVISFVISAHDAVTDFVTQTGDGVESGIVRVAYPIMSFASWAVQVVLVFMGRLIDIPFDSYRGYFAQTYLDMGFTVCTWAHFLLNYPYCGQFMELWSSANHPL